MLEPNDPGCRLADEEVRAIDCSFEDGCDFSFPIHDPPERHFDTHVSGHLASMVVGKNSSCRGLAS
jgi:hypothetical protein